VQVKVEQTQITLFGSNGYVWALERWSCRDAKVEVPEVSRCPENSHLGPPAVKLKSGVTSKDGGRLACY
jgi:hypothetical protein